MAPKKREKKSTTKSVTEEIKEQAQAAEENPNDLQEKLRAQGITITFSQDSNRINHRNVRDISVPNLTLAYQGTPLIEEAEFNLNYGNRYGFVGRNGCGKSTFMKCIAAKCFPIPEGIDVFHVSEEIEASTMTAKEAVMSVDKERNVLEKEAELLNEMMTGEEGDEFQDEIIDRLNQVTSCLHYTSPQLVLHRSTNA
jgi:ATP-binding cassette, subfamily F, member 2